MPQKNTIETKRYQQEDNEFVTFQATLAHHVLIRKLVKMGRLVSGAAKAGNQRHKEYVGTRQLSWSWLEAREEAGFYQEKMISMTIHQAEPGSPEMTISMSIPVSSPASEDEKSKVFKLLVNIFQYNKEERRVLAQDWSVNVPILMASSNAVLSESMSAQKRANQLKKYVYQYFGSPHGGTKHLDEWCLSSDGEPRFWFHDVYQEGECEGVEPGKILIVFADNGDDYSALAFQKLRTHYQYIPWSQYANAVAWEK